MIIFTQHALLKLKQRNISKTLVLQTLNQPEQISPTRQNRFVAFKKFGKLHLKVIFRKENKNIIVITQHLVEKII
ncbi:DUF4258 domain-containing protein [Patescibacteria group bacterium]|nr:DUF4258 domain-containing protein [Patescibacteria group bacterium]